VKKGNEWGFANTAGKEVISCIYLEVEKFENGKSKVRSKTESFYIDKAGNRIIK
jgi:hypothetical protein